MKVWKQVVVVAIAAVLVAAIPFCAKGAPTSPVDRSDATVRIDSPDGLTYAIMDQDLTRAPNTDIEEALQGRTLYVAHFRLFVRESDVFDHSGFWGVTAEMCREPTGSAVLGFDDDLKLIMAGHWTEGDGSSNELLAKELCKRVPGNGV